MRPLLTLTALLILAFPCAAQLVSNEKVVKGNFYVSVDDAVEVFINGTSAYKVSRGESRSPDMEIKTGDRVVVHLRNDGDKRYFMLVFASPDSKTVVSFRNRDFKIIPELNTTDFTPEQFQKWNKYAKEDKRKPVLPVKSYSEWVWGDLDSCILACVITPQMITQRTR